CGFGDTRPLLSLPARRSSGLGARARRGGRGPDSAAVGALASARGPGGPLRRGVLPPSTADQEGRASSSGDMCASLYLRANAPERDRKSTRLNSSHVSISYAVF